MKTKNILAYITAILFNFAGGFADAYSFSLRDGVFSSMQTGNLLQLFMLASTGVFSLRHLLPIITFIMGTVFAVLLKKCTKWERIALCIFPIITVVASLCPLEYGWNIVSNCAVAFTCAMQFECFRNCCGIKYTSTMCTNNIRLCSKSMVEYICDKKKNNKVWFYGTILITFIIGCVAGVFASQSIGKYAYLIVFGVYVMILALYLCGERLTKK